MTPAYLAPVALVAALTAVGAHLRIPLPYVPITLQAAIVCLGGLLLGARRGALSQIVYVAAGLIGFPVFAKGGGLHYVLEPSFGYLIGFVVGAALCGSVAGSHPRFVRYLAACWSGMLGIYVVGITGLYLNLTLVAGTELSAWQIVQLGAAPLPKDLLVGLLAAWAGVRLRHAVTGRYRV